MNVLIAVMRSGTEGKLPRRIAWRVMIEENASTRLSQLPDVGVIANAEWQLCVLIAGQKLAGRR